MMRRSHFMSRFGDFFETMGSAMAVSAAMQNRRPARKSDLQRLGIDPDQFRQISRY